MTRLSDMQRLVVEQSGRRDSGRDLLVSAGAGSGKTLVLVESVLACLRAGTPLERILVVTFTDKAASGMRNRIYRKLEEDPDLAPLRLRLAHAWISTIHSFCLRLLRERFKEAKVDPRFRVLSEEDAHLRLDDAMSRVFHHLYTTVSIRRRFAGAFEELVEMCGFGPEGERLRSVVRRLLDYARTSGDPAGFLSGHRNRIRRRSRSWDDLVWVADYSVRVRAAWSLALGLLQALVREIERSGKDPGTFAGLLRSLEAIDPAGLATPASQRDTLGQLAGAGILRERTSVTIKLPTLPSGLGKALAPLRAAVAKAFASEWLTDIPVDEEQAVGDERKASRLGFALLEVTRRVWNGYEAAKERTGRLDFEDLQIRALRLIEEAAKTDLAIRFDKVFIDEFQDVNTLQHRILSQVADQSGIFRVGDIKQSIYQFRLANPEIIRQLGSERPLVKDPRQAPEQSAAWNVLLPTNYRSLRPVLAFVNEIAGGLFQSSEIGTSYEEQALVAGGDLPYLEPHVEMILAHAVDAEESEEEGQDAEEGPDLHETEWTAIARRIRELIESEAPVRDPDSDEIRPVRYSDIAILLRARSSGPSLARCLEAEGIPCALGADASFFEAREVQDLLQILRATDNLLDDIALAASLRSPAFGWADAELLSLRLAYPQAVHIAFALARLADRATGDSRYGSTLLPEDPAERDLLCGDPEDLPDETPFSDLPGRSAGALDRFLSWRDAAGSLELPELLTRVLQDTGLLRSVTSLPGGLRRQGNLRKFLGISRRYVEEAGHNLHRFLRWLDALQEGGARISEAPISSESVPSVRILTIHAAKGLEFPVVFLAEMGRKYQIGERGDALVPGRRFLGVRLLEREEYLLRRPYPLRLLLDSRRDEDLAEEKRILYVGLTRARDRLILSGIYGKRTIPPESLRRTYRETLHREDGIGHATAQHLLAAKPYPLAWVLYTLPPLDPPPGAGEQAIEGHLLTVRWVIPTARAQAAGPPNPIRALEPVLRTLGAIEIPGGDDPAVEEVVGRTLRRTPLPSPGSLRTLRGKLWATELKGDRGFPPAMTRAEDEESDEPAVPIIPPDRDAAAEEGTMIHSLLERLELTGLDHGNLETRIADAAAEIGGIPPAVGRTVQEALARLLTLPLGRALASGSEVHREVSFSLRVPMLEIPRWLPDLRNEILDSGDWIEWIEPDGSGAFRIRADRPAEAGDPWVLVQGRIDLVLRESDGWTVLDWKSDSVTAGRTLDDRLALYRGQVEIYRRAVGHLFGTPVRAVLFFLRPGILREV